MWKILGSFLKCHRISIGMFILITGIFGLFSWLYGLPVKAVGYAALLSLAAGMTTGVIKFKAFYRKCRCLNDMRSSVNLDIEDLPKSVNDIEAAYTELIGILHKEQKKLVIQSDERGRKAKQYYTLWVHQIKTPIAALRLLLQTEGDLEREGLAAELFEIEQYVEMVLSYARLESESTDYLIDYFDLDQIVRQAVRKYARLFIRKKIRLNFRESGISVLTDEKWLVFVIEQILSNALKYTSEGSIDIWVEEETRSLIVEDTGIGIAAEDLPRIFEQGFTGYNGRVGKKSTGIGLYLVKYILKKLSHTIEIQSEPGHGTKVTISLDSSAGEMDYNE